MSWRFITLNMITKEACELIFRMFQKHVLVDVSMSEGRGMLLRYVSRYVPNFSSSFASDWLNDDATASSITRRILNDFHPLELEMWLQMYSHQIPHR